MNNDFEKMTLYAWSERFQNKTLFQYRYFQLPDKTVIAFDPFQKYTIIYKSQKQHVDLEELSTISPKDESYQNLQQLITTLQINFETMGIAYKRNPKIGTQ